MTTKRKSIKKNEKHLLVNIESTTKTSNIEIEDTEGYIKEQLYFDDFFDDKKFNKFLKKVESTVRRSDAYTSFINACFTKGLDHCAILGNVESSKEVTIEMHHYPFTLYDIAYLCTLKHIKNKDKFTSIDIANEILYDHIYNKIICVVPLCKTVHQLAHLGKIFIPLTSITGDINGFLDKYKDELTPDMKESYNKLLEMTESGTPYSDEDILKTVKEYESEHRKK